MATPLMEQIEGKYEILEKMGEGGMGAVYKVRHRLLEEIRVIKVMRPHLAADENLRERFLREAKTAIRLRHPNVAQLHDCTVDDEGNAFMVIEYIEGVTLEEMLKEGGTPPIGLTLEIAGQSLKALGSLHRKKVIHRDIAPDNLMLSRDDEGEPLVKLIDLGIAKVLEAVDAGLTATGMFIGKLRYSSPEHFRTHDGASVDARSDLYSFGVVLYEMLTGTHPIEGESMSSLIAGHLVHPPLDFAKSDPEGRVPDDLRAIVLKSLAKDPGDRFQNAAEFRKALTPIAKRFPAASADVDRALSATPPPTIRFPAMRKGSTQEKLDRQFIPEVTPPQPFTEVTPPPASRGARSDVDGAPAGAVKTAEAEQVAAVAEVARRVEAHLAGGKLREASKELVDAEAKYGPAEKLVALKQRIEGERGREQQRRRAEALKAEATALSEQNDYDAALAKLQQAVEIVPADTAVQVQIADIEAARAKAAAVAQAVVLVERLVGAGDLEAAERELNEAVLRLGESAPLLGSKKKIEARRASQRHWQERVQALISEGREALSSGALQEARSRLDEASSLAPDAAEVTGFAADLAAAESAREQEQRRREEIREAVDGITRRIDSGALPAARSALDKAERQFQDTESFRELNQRLGSLEAQSERERALARAVRSVESELVRGRLEQAQKEVLAAVAELGELEALQGLRARVEAELTTRRERDEKVAALVEDAHQRAAAGELEMALERLREANRFDPEDASVQALIGDFEAALRRREEERKRQEQISAAAARIERHLEGGALEKARGELDRATKTSGDADQLVKLRERLEVAEKRALAEQLQRLLGVARQLFEAERFEEAIAQLKTARNLDSSDQTVAELLGKCQEALRGQRQERKQQQRVAKSVAAVDDLLGAGKVTKASRRLAAAEKRFGPNEVLQALRQRVEKAVAAAPAPAQPLQRRLLAPLVISAVIVAIVVVVVMVQRRGAEVASSTTLSGGASAATSTLLVNAVPWAQITAIVAADSTPLPVPEGGYTPIVLALPPGSYTLTLTHPSRAEPVMLQVTLEDGARVSEVVELETPDLNSFFKDMGW